MSKYDWKQLEKEYILSDYKSVSAFLKDKKINNNGTTRKHTTGWKDKKRQKEDKKATKTIEKAIEKEAEKEAQQIVDIKSIANDLAINIIKANKELNRYITKNRTKSKTIIYDAKTLKPSKEVVTEKEEVAEHFSIIDRQGLKMLTSALKDISDILIPNDEDKDEHNSFIEALNGKTEEVWDEEE